MVRPLVPLALVLLCACQDADAGGVKDSQALQKTQAQLDKVKAELSDARRALADAKARLQQLQQLRKQGADENGDRPPLPPPGDSIRCETPERCTIERAYYDEVMGNPLRLLDQVRIVPWQVDGEMGGIKLFGIDEGSIPAALGLKGGDVVVAVGGQPLTSFNDLMALGSTLGPASRYELRLLRDGKELTVVMEIVGEPAPVPEAAPQSP
ncbi:MAG: hypothetical protein H6712_31130 [Myxococcales bacterium]|nr:hypothetical protein [Myxococcales bacterium]MCB9718345.1 hypothetical protein [Myxococcales bacterium]